MSLASSLFSVVATHVFTLLVEGLRERQKSIADYLQELLVEFREIIREELDIKDLQHYWATSVSCATGFGEYLNSKNDKAVLDDVMFKTRDTLANLSALKFLGYRVFMITAGLRLAILQEYTRLRNLNGELIKDERFRAISFHRQTVGEILHATDPRLVTYRIGGQNWAGKWSAVPGNVRVPDLEAGEVIRYTLFNERILSEPVNGTVFLLQRRVDQRRVKTVEEMEPTPKQLETVLAARDGNNNPIVYAPKIVRLSEVRRKLLTENIDVGNKMIERWNEAALRPTHA